MPELVVFSDGSDAVASVRAEKLADWMQMGLWARKINELYMVITKTLEAGENPALCRNGDGLYKASVRYSD